MPSNPIYSVDQIHSDFQITLEENPHKIDFPEGFVDKVFEEACKKKPLFNGTLVCVKEFILNGITAYPISFKEFLASYHLGANRVHRPLAVSGWIEFRGRILFGVRSQNVLFSAGKLELVPSGSIDEAAIEGQTINYEYALINEFEQETGLLIDDVETIKPELLVLCKEKQIFDICQSIKLKDDSDAQTDPSNDEYSQFFWVSLEDIPAFLQKNKSLMHSTTLAIIESKLIP